MYKDKKIFILGLARSGYEVAKLLHGEAKELVVVDENKEDPHIKELEDMGIKVIIADRTVQADYLDDSFDLVVKNPGAPLDVSSVVKAEQLNIPITNEAEVAYHHFPKGVKIVAITGSNGKTTTTTITYEILKEAKLPVVLGGNIGIPISAIVKDLKENSILVMEVSCQQLNNLKDFNPDISVMTNISPAHIDFFKSYDTYKKVKAKIFQNQKKENIAILNIENEEVMEMSKDIKAQVRYFSSRNEINGCYNNNGMITYYDEEIMKVKDVFIKGIHNIENVMAAIMVAKAFKVNNDTIISVLQSFKGVEHRIEFVANINGVSYYNDSKATNIKSTQTALSSFNERVILILGGLERNQNLNDLTPFMNHVKAIVGIGQCRQRILDYGTSIEKPTYIFEYLKDGFDKCVELSEAGDLVLLSPATASWDQYEKFEDRGDEFKELVKNIK